MDREFLRQAWKDWQPDLVYHLAAQAYNGESWKAEDSTYLFNIQGSRNVFETHISVTPKARIIPACSSAEYGFVENEDTPINEDTTPLRPVTPYGVTKAAMEMMARQFHLNYGMDVVLPRLFIHVGPDHPPVTALQNFASQLASVMSGIQEPVIKTGNLESSRDFVDVRDGVMALLILAEKGCSGQVYNICAGKAWTMKEALDILIRISRTQTEIRRDNKLFRPSDEKILLGDPSKIKALGWEPVIPFEKTLEDILANWVKRLAK
jgi:GDP-4-dehydro-6-deoxy-D-mannose reductase